MADNTSSKKKAENPFVPSEDKIIPNSDQPARVLDEKAEKYLRESGEIEDLPEEEDMEAYEEALRKNEKRRTL